MKETNRAFLWNALCAAFAAAMVFTNIAPAGAAVGQRAGNFGSPIGGVSPGAEKYFTVNMKPGATIQDAMIVAQYFHKFGMLVDISPDAQIVFVHGMYGQAGAAAHTGFIRYQLNSMQFTRLSAPESYPPAVASRILATTLNDGPPLVPLGILVGPGNGYTPANAATYYDYTPIATAGFKGTGRKVAIIACGVALATDVKKYESMFSLPSNVPTVTTVDGGSGGVNSFEPTVDVERMLGTANAVSITLYDIPVSSCTLGNLADGFAKAASDNVTKHYDAVSIGYGDTEDVIDAIGADNLITSIDTDISNLQTHGAWTFVSSGDTGAFPPTSQLLEGFELTVIFPASDNKVIAVGGTSATSKSTTTIARNREPAWGGSGGGVSGKFAIPAWQKGLAGLQSTTERNVPDVAYDADPNTGFEFIYTPSGGSQGAYIAAGTSAGAPTWAATLALVDQKRVAASKAVLKSVATDIYAAAKTTGPFIDIIAGCNGFYCANTGYDAVTGLGVPDGDKLWLNLTGLASGK